MADIGTVDQLAIAVVYDPLQISYVDQLAIAAVWGDVASSGDTSRRLAGDSIQGGPTAPWAGSGTVGDA